MGSALGAWSRLLPGKPERRTPATNLVESLIGLQDRRDEKDRLQRAEERQARLDAQQAEELRKAEEWRLHEAQIDLDARTSQDEIVTKEIMSNLVPMAMGSELPVQPERPSMEREKVTEKRDADGGVTKTVDRPLQEEIDAGIVEETQGIPDVVPLLQKIGEYQERQRRTDLPETRTGPMGEYAPEFLEPRLQRLMSETAVSPAAYQADAYSSMRQQPMTTEEKLEYQRLLAEGKLEDAKKLIDYKLSRGIGTSTSGGTQARKPYYDTEEKKERLLTQQELGEYEKESPGRFVNYVTGRKFGEESELQSRMETLMIDTKYRLRRFQEDLSVLSPAKSWANWQSYKKSSESLGQLFGRQVLRDVRVSEQDRAVYAATIAVTNLPMMMIAPDEAWARMILFEKLMGKYETKYGSPPEGKLASDFLPVDASHREKAEAMVQDQIDELKKEYKSSGGGVPATSQDESGVVKMIVKDGMLVPEGQ